MKIAMISRATLFSSKGGDTVQILETANSLRKLGVEVDVYTTNQEINYTLYDYLHFFNIIRPNTIIPHIKKSKKPFVVSTIYVDYAEVDKELRGPKWKLVSSLLGKNRIEYLKIIARRIRNGEKIIDKRYLLRGHRNSVRYILKKAKCILPNSKSEYDRIVKDFGIEATSIVVPNAVSDDFAIDINNLPEKESTVLCIARVEIRKNQLSLIQALNDTNIQLKIIGKPSPNHADYLSKCKKEAKENVVFLGELTKYEVIEELKKSKVHVLPSWFETTGLSTLEAIAMGCNVVVTNKGDTQEYFEGHAEFCNPKSIDSIKLAVKTALNSDFNLEAYQNLDNNYRWRFAAEQTLKAYKL